jgi:hypothetical protein
MESVKGCESSSMWRKNEGRSCVQAGNNFSQHNPRKNVSKSIWPSLASPTSINNYEAARYYIYICTVFSLNFASSCSLPVAAASSCSISSRLFNPLFNIDETFSQHKCNLPIHFTKFLWPLASPTYIIFIRTGDQGERENKHSAFWP